MRLGVLDAGLGGLTVVSQILARQPDVDLIYLGERRNVPFNVKGIPWIVQRAQALVDYLADRADHVVLACNTISTVADRLRGPP